MGTHHDYAYGIDALRFICAIFVAAFHLTYRNTDGIWIMPYGWIGVQVFFVISGVVIANSAYGTTAANFMRGRILRLYPAAWIAAFLNLAIIVSIPGSAYEASGIFVLPEFDAFKHSFTLVGDYFLTTSYWTLPIELSFYSVILLALLTNGKVSLVAVARILILLSCPYLLAALAHQVGLVSLPWTDLQYGLKNALLVRHGPFFAIGIYIWHIDRNRSAGKADIVFIAISLALAIIEISLRAMQVLPFYAIGKSGAMTLHFLLVSSVLVFFAGLAWIHLSLRHRNVINLSGGAKNILRALGLMTYPLYLLHESVGGFVLYVFTQEMGPLMVRITVAIAIAGAAAYLVSTTGEPILRRYLRALLSLDFAISGPKRRGTKPTASSKTYHPD